MTQEDKELLLKDLSARLPYGVKIRYHYRRGDVIIDEDRELDFSDVETLKYNNKYSQDTWCDISWKPYLRPMSSMTEEERGELRKLYNYKDDGYAHDDYELVDWKNAHHFDYRGLIGKGLALKAPEDMYKD